MTARPVALLHRCCTVALCAAVLAGCNASLPEPDSPGAQLYAAHCRTCHRLYAPSALTFDLWKIKVDVMQGEMVRRGIPPLTAAERALLLDYLRRHSDGGARAQAANRGER